MVRSLLTTALVLVLGTTSLSAQTQYGEHPDVVLDVEPCWMLQRAEIRKLVQIELGDLLLAEDAQPGPATTQVRVRCTTRGVRILLHDEVSGRKLTRELELESPSQPVRNRMVALAVVETLATSWVEVEAPPETAADGRPKTGPGAPAVAAAREAERDRWSGGMTLAWRHFLAGGIGQPGLGLSLTHRPWELFGWGCQVEIERAGHPAGPGSVEVVAASAALYALSHRRWGGVTLAGGPGLRLGWVDMRGQSWMPAIARGANFAAPWGGPMLRGAVEARVTSLLYASLGAEVDLVTLSAAGTFDDSTLLSLEGPAVSIFGGVGANF